MDKKEKSEELVKEITGGGEKTGPRSIFYIPPIRESDKIETRLILLCSGQEIIEKNIKLN